MKFNIRGSYNGKYASIEVEENNTKIDLGMLNSAEIKQLVMTLEEAVDELSTYIIDEQENQE